MRDVSSVDRAPGSGPGGRRFDSFTSLHQSVRSSVRPESSLWKRDVAGSNPAAQTIILAALLLTSCAAPRTLDVTLLTHGGEPFVLRDRGGCVLVTGREVSYGQLGAMIKECFQEK